LACERVSAYAESTQWQEENQSKLGWRSRKSCAV